MAVAKKPHPAPIRAEDSTLRKRTAAKKKPAAKKAANKKPAAKKKPAS